jgi:RecA/RadA recombinase
MSATTTEKEILEAEEVVGAYLFLHPEALHIPYSLRALNYRARNPHFKELLEVASAGLSGGGVNFRAHLSPDSYRFWNDKSFSLSLSPTHYEQVADALLFLCDVARYDSLRTTLNDLARNLTPHNVTETIHSLLERTASVLHNTNWRIQSGSILQEQYTARLRSIYETKNLPLYSHIHFLDGHDIFFPRREYTLISGRTGSGKTSMACILTYNLLFSHERNDRHAAPRPLNVLYISLEVPSEAILAKILGTFTHRYILKRAPAGELSQFSDDEINTLKHFGWNDFYAKTTPEKFELTIKVLDAFREKVGDRLSIYHSPVLTGDDVVLLVTSKALELAADGQTLDVVIIDFIQNLRTRSEAKGQGKEGASLSREIGHTIQELQQVFSRFEICGIILSQVNDMGEVRDSRVLEHLAAVHIRIGNYYRDFSPLFERYLRGSGKFKDGKPVDRASARQLAETFNDIAQKLPNKKLLDISVSKNRYGDEVRTPQILMWRPAIPLIVRGFEIAEAINELEKEQAKKLPKSTTEETPTLAEPEDTTPIDDFPF